MQHQPTPFDNIPVRLTIEELVNPSIVLSNFFDRYSLKEIRSSLDDLVIQAMSSEMPELDHWRERNNILYFRYQLESLLEASYLVARKRESSSNTRRKRMKKLKKIPAKGHIQSSS
jgi:hypothetical protein